MKAVDAFNATLLVIWWRTKLIFSCRMQPFINKSQRISVVQIFLRFLDVFKAWSLHHWHFQRCCYRGGTILIISMFWTVVATLVWSLAQTPIVGDKQQINQSEIPNNPPKPLNQSVSSLGSVARMMLYIFCALYFYIYMYTSLQNNISQHK